MGDFILGMIAMFAIGTFINSCSVTNNIQENMVEHHLAHYDERSKEYVKDSIRHSENFDTIFVIKRSAK